MSAALTASLAEIILGIYGIFCIVVFLYMSSTAFIAELVYRKATYKYRDPYQRSGLFWMTVIAASLPIINIIFFFMLVFNNVSSRRK